MFFFSGYCEWDCFQDFSLSKFVFGVLKKILMFCMSILYPAVLLNFIDHFKQLVHGDLGFFHIKLCHEQMG
jgi:hypothetical protein